MCHEHWTDQSSFENSARNVGATVPIADVTFGFSGGESRGASSYSAAYDKFCNMTSDQYDLYLETIRSSVDPRAALGAWLGCIQTAAAAQGFFAGITESPNYDSFTVRLIYKTGGIPQYNINSINLESGVTCSVGNAPLTTPRQVNTGEFNFQCRKPPERTTMLSFNTSAGAPPVMQTAGTALTEADARQLQQTVLALQQQLRALSDLAPQVARLSVDQLRQRLKVYGPTEAELLPCTAYRDYASAHPGSEPWPHAIVKKQCPSGQVRITGGCSFTCFSLEHTESIPTEDNGWSCGAVSSDPPTHHGKFGPFVACLTP